MSSSSRLRSLALGVEGLALLLVLLPGAPGCEMQRNRHRRTAQEWTDMRLREGETTSFADAGDPSPVSELRLRDYAHREDGVGPLSETTSGIVLDRPQVVSLDGAWLEKRPAARILLTPGAHVIRVVNTTKISGIAGGGSRTMTSQAARLELSLEPGVSYDVFSVSGPAGRQPALYRGGRLSTENVFGPIRSSDLADWTSWIWVEDSRTHQPIAGTRPGSPED